MDVLANITKDHSQDFQSGVWEPGHGAFSPQWCLVAVLLVGALCIQKPMARQRTYTTQARPVALSLSKALKSTLQSQASHGQRL